MDNSMDGLMCGTPELPPGFVALTFDDGPGPKSAELARLLRDEGVPGTFFVLGESIRQYGDVLPILRECGHVIGLHGDRHRRFRSAKHAASQLRLCAEQVSAHADEAAWFRPPYGVGDWTVPGFAGPVGWHASGRDWDITYRKGQTVEACLDAIAQRLIERGGGIALLHDFAPASEFRPACLTAETLDLRVIEITRLLIERLRAAGLSFTALPPPPSEPKAAVSPTASEPKAAVSPTASEPKAAVSPGLRSRFVATKEGDT
jgi:peptidoglycan/xylan/chitin deacetylase (PgdA/CDA1 family)